MSREHFEIARRGRLHWIRDLDSTNGTYLGAARLGENGSLLADGAIIRAGDSVFVFREADVSWSEIVRQHDDPLLPGVSPEIVAIRRRIDHLARQDVVLIQGATGTGKAFAARAIHERGGRAPAALVLVNCPELNLQLQVPGSGAGHWLGGMEERPDRTLFLDEIGDLDERSQALLTRYVSRRGPPDVSSVGSGPRLVAATQHDLELAVQEGRLRRDLIARLFEHVEPVRMPPLRARVEDIPIWVRRFLTADGTPAAAATPACTAGFIETLLLHDWPNNLRELRAVLSLARLSCAERARPDSGDRELLVLTSADAPADLESARSRSRRECPPDPGPAASTMRASATAAPGPEAIRAALAASNGNMRQAAMALAVPRVTLYRMCRRNGIQAEDFREEAPPTGPVDDAVRRRRGV